MEATYSCNIKHAALDDTLVLADLGARTFFQTYQGMMDTADLQAYIDESFQENKIREELRNNRIHYLISEINSRPAGYSKLDFNSPCTFAPNEILAELCRIYVDQTYHGMGLGKKLYEHQLKIAHKRGCTALWLSVWQKNAKAQEFYKKLGFKIIGEQDFQVGSDVQRDFIYIKNIA